MPLNYLISEQKHNLFGRIEFTPAPTSADSSAIRITNGWNKEHLSKVFVPQLVILAQEHPRLGNFPADGHVFWNKKAEQALLTFFRLVEEKGLLDRILSFGGTWAPRFVRGSSKVLSSHAWATAIDINVAWNPLGRTPAALGKKGCVQELVPVAEACGFYWGGNFPRKDGMHFEVSDPDAWTYAERT